MIEKRKVRELSASELDIPADSPMWASEEDMMAGLRPEDFPESVEHTFVVKLSAWRTVTREVSSLADYPQQQPKLSADEWWQVADGIVEALDPDEIEHADDCYQCEERSNHCPVCDVKNGAHTRECSERCPECPVEE